MNNSIEREVQFLGNEFDRYYIFLILIIAGFFAFSTNIAVKVDDNFHEGEYLGLVWHMIDYYRGNTPFPVLIHGAMDYLPVLTAKYIYGDDCLIIGTRLINTIIAFLVWILFLDLCRMAVNIASGDHIVHVFYLVSFTFLVPRLYSDALAIQQNFLSVRDFFLILATWSLFRIHNNIRDQKPTILFIFICCLAVSVGLYWNYSRGIVGALMFFSFLLAFIMNRYYSPIWVSVFSIIICFLALEIWGKAGPLSSNLENIFYWIKNSQEIWGTSIFSSTHTTLIFCFYLIFTVSITILTYISIFLGKKHDRYLYSLIISLVIAQAVLLKSASNRFTPNLFWPIWPYFLILLYLVPNIFPYFNKEKITGTSKLISILSKAYYLIVTEVKKIMLYYPSNEFKKISRFLFFVAFFSVFLAFLVSNNSIRYISFFKNAAFPHKDKVLVSKEISSVIDNMDGVPCFFAWTNEGIIALMLKKPFCSRFTYAVYASRSYQEEIIASLNKNNPKLILTGSASVSVEFDDKPMSKRLPNVNDFLEKNYKFKSQIYDYIISIKTK